MEATGEWLHFLKSAFNLPIRASPGEHLNQSGH